MAVSSNLAVHACYRLPVAVLLSNTISGVIRAVIYYWEKGHTKTLR